MSKKKTILFTTAFLFCAAAGLYFVLGIIANESKTIKSEGVASKSATDNVVTKMELKPQATAPSSVDNVEALSQQVLSEIEAERRLNISMTAQLRSYRDLMRMIKEYAESVEKDIDLIKEITKSEFQENVKLQASLFTGKKPALVAKHLEEFHPTRVGAILAKMKEKEASNVLDVWAKNKTSDISLFYRQVVEIYLLNKRHDMNPELFDHFTINSSANRCAGWVDT